MKMVLKQYELVTDNGKFVRNDNGTYERKLTHTYNVLLAGDRLIVNNHYMRLIYDPNYAIGARNNAIYTTYDPAEFFKQFFIDEFWRDCAFKICEHVCKNGKREEKGNAD